MNLFEEITDMLTTDMAEYIADNLGVDSNTVSKIILDYLTNKPTPSPKSVKRKKVKKC